MPGQLIIVGDHFAFAWLPLGVQIFFMRVPDNIASQLETLEKDREMLTRLMSNSVEEEELAEEDGQINLGDLGLNSDFSAAERSNKNDDEGDLFASG